MNHSHKNTLSLSVKKFIAILTALLLFISFGQMVVAIYGSKQLSENLKVMIDIHFPSSRYISHSDMLHDALRAVALKSIVISETKTVDEVKEIQDELKDFSTQFRENIQNLKLLNLSKLMRDAIEKVEPALERYVIDTEKIVQLGTSGKKVEATLAMVDFQKSFKLLEDELEALGELAENETNNEKSISLAHIENSDFILKLTTVLGFCFGIFFFLFITRKTNSRLQLIVANLSSNSKEVNDLSQNLLKLSASLFQSSQTQASSLQETASSLAEISSMMDKTKDSGKLLKGSSVKNISMIQEGNNNIQLMNQSIDQIYTGSMHLFEEVEKSNQRFQEILILIKDIETKTKVINDIVFQTKLLSFNASVEAARAGEAGKGFSIVAEEVGNLANMSGKASHEISQLIHKSTLEVEKIVSETKSYLLNTIEKSKKEIENGKEASLLCQTSFEQIQESTMEIDKNLEEIIAAVDEQAVGVREINNAAQELDKTTNELSHESHSLSKSIEQLVENGKTLEKSIDSIHELAGNKLASIIKIPSSREDKKTAA